MCVKFAKGSPGGGGEGGVSGGGCEGGGDFGGDFGSGGEGGGGDGGGIGGGSGGGDTGFGGGDKGGGTNGEISTNGSDGGGTLWTMLGMRACSYVKVMNIANVYKIPDTAIPAVTTKLVFTILSAFVPNQSIFEKTTFLDWSHKKNN